VSRAERLDGRWRRTRALATGVLALATATPAHASDSTVRLRVEGGACANEATIVARLARRGVRVTESPGAVLVEVRVAETSGGFEAAFVLASDDGAAPPAPRTLEAPSCEEALDALSFALALAIDRGEIAAQPAATGSPGATPANKDVAPEPAAQGAPAAAATAEPGPSPGGAPIPVAPRSPEGRIVIGFALGGAGVAGVAPTVALGGGVSGEIAWIRAGLSPSLRAGFLAVPPVSHAAAGYDLRMALQAASLDACPTRVSVAGVALVPCVRARVGRLQASGGGFNGALLANALWADLGAVLRAEVAVGAQLALEAEIAADAPLARESFFFGATGIYTVTSVGGQVGVGMSAHFP
jgi:hypothetical protein